MKKFLTFKNGFFLVIALFCLQTCSKCSTKREFNYYKQEVERTSTKQDSLINIYKLEVAELEKRISNLQVGHERDSVQLLKYEKQLDKKPNVIIRQIEKHE